MTSFYGSCPLSQELSYYLSMSTTIQANEDPVIGVPAAFSPGCSDTHIPGYLASDKLKDAGKVFVVSVNDAFV